MQSLPAEIICDVQLQPGEPLALPPEAGTIIGPGKWRISIASVPPSAAQDRVLGHTAFLAGYAAEDEGLYDDDSAG